MHFSWLQNMGVRRGIAGQTVVRRPPVSPGDCPTCFLPALQDWLFGGSLLPA